MLLNVCGIPKKGGDGAMKSVLKKLLAVAGIGVVLLVILLVVVFLNLSSIARKATEETLSYVLKVDVSVGKMDISIADGSVEIGNMVIGNPEGFKTSEAFALERVFVQADLKSFAGDQPVVKDIVVEGANVTLEQSLKGSNLSKIADNAASLKGDSPEESADDSPEEQASKKVIVDRFLMEGSKVSLSAPVLQGKKISFTVPKVELTEIGRKGTGVTIAEALQTIIQAILKSALKAGGSVIPEDVSKVLSGTLTTVGETGKAVTDQLKETGEGLTDNVKDIGKGIGGLFKKK